ncbi:MAG: A24 family peptidase [Kiritimatiellia bacterium]
MLSPELLTEVRNMPAAMNFIAVFVVFFGACVGSYLNVCIYRIPREESTIKPRSHCPHCGKLIAWYDNIPLLSWMALRAKCRNCKGKISSRYILVEALVAVLFFLVWMQYGLSPKTPVYWLMMGGLVLGTFVDFEHMIIPDRVSLGGLAAGLILSPLIPSLHGKSFWLDALMASAIGAALGGGLLYGVGVLGKMAFKKDAMGLGDVKLLAGLGAFLGWRAVLFIIMVSSFIGAFVGMGFIIAKKHEWQSRIPYGPYIALAAMIWILWGPQMWNWYLTMLSGGAAMP